MPCSVLRLKPCLKSAFKLLKHCFHGKKKDEGI